MNYSVFWKVLDYILLPFFARLRKVESHQFGWRRNTACWDAVMVLKKAVLDNGEEDSNVQYTTVEFSKTYECINMDRRVDLVHWSAWQSRGHNTLRGEKYFCRNGI